MAGHNTIRIHTAHNDLEFKTFGKENAQEILSTIEYAREETRESTLKGSTHGVIKGENEIEKLERLGKLMKDGLITEKEFEAQKKKVLARL